MFDFSKLADMSKLAGEVKGIQKKQEELQNLQIELLKKISSQLEEIKKLIKNKFDR